MTRQIVWLVTKKDDPENVYAICTYPSDADVVVGNSGSGVHSVPYILDAVDIEHGVLSLRIDLNAPAIMDTALAGEQTYYNKSEVET